MTKKLSVNITDETAADLRELSQRDEASITETVRRAVSVYKYIYDEVAKGKELKLVSDDEITTLRLT
jgi:hypothetical protein